MKGLVQMNQPVECKKKVLPDFKTAILYLSTTELIEYQTVCHRVPKGQKESIDLPKRT